MLAANKENDIITRGPHMGKMNAKTPGPSKPHPKTPFKVPLNDENVAGKTGKKGMFAGKDPSLFVTPIGPRGGPRRPALTGKTTNAKARRFTPPEEDSAEQQQKPVGSVSRLSGSKISISQDMRPVLHGEGREYPEIEYMPLCPPELPDIPDDFLIPDYDKLSKNIYKGCHRQFLLDIDEFGKTSVERQIEESERQINAMLDAETEELLDPPIRRGDAVRSKKNTASITANSSKQKREVEATATVKSTAAKRPASRTTSRPASALSTTSSVTSRKGPLANTSAGPAALIPQRPASSISTTRPSAPSKTASHSRSVSVSVMKKPLSFSRSSRTMPPPPRPENRTRAVVSSKSTIGYTNRKEVGKEMKRILIAGPKETAIEACERILREDEDESSSVVLPLAGQDDVGYEDPIVAPPHEDSEEEFYMQVPE